jgi:DNA-binding transcriptional MerR regulator
MSYTIALDWMSFTLKGLQDETLVLQTVIPDGEISPITPSNGYTRAIASNLGIQLHTNPDRTEMGTHIVIPGSALRLLEQSGTSTRRMLEIAIRAGAKFTRIDLAKDAQNEGISLKEIYAACDRHERTGTAQKIREWREPDGGHTIYVGAPTSDAQVRMYNKSAEQHIDGDWQRMEFQARGHVAKSWARVLAEPDADWNALLCGRVKKMLNVDVDGYNRWLCGAATEGLPQVEKRSDREKWILTQVLPAILEHLKNNPNSEAIALLKSSMDFALSGRGDILQKVDKP